MHRKPWQLTQIDEQCNFSTRQWHGYQTVSSQGNSNDTKHRCSHQQNKPCNAICPYQGSGSCGAAKRAEHLLLESCILLLYPGMVYLQWIRAASYLLQILQQKDSHSVPEPQLQMTSSFHVQQNGTGVIWRRLAPFTEASQPKPQTTHWCTKSILQHTRMSLIL